MTEYLGALVTKEETKEGRGKIFEFHYEPPGTRTVLVRDDRWYADPPGFSTMRWEHPGLLLVPIYSNWRKYLGMWVVQVLQRPEAPLFSCPFYDTEVPNGGCLGAATRLVHIGVMSPVEVFWNTSWSVTEAEWRRDFKSRSRLSTPWPNLHETLVSSYGELLVLES